MSMCRSGKAASRFLNAVWTPASPGPTVGLCWMYESTTTSPSPSGSLVASSAKRRTSCLFSSDIRSLPHSWTTTPGPRSRRTRPGPCRSFLPFPPRPCRPPSNPRAPGKADLCNRIESLPSGPVRAGDGADTLHLAADDEVDQVRSVVGERLPDRRLDLVRLLHAGGGDAERPGQLIEMDV